jgi:serine/threonine protein kinase
MHMTVRVGQQMGNYTLLRLLGEGGFAEVYLGEHLHLGTQAAIKVLQTQLSEENTADFRNEARTIARLIHPHIVRVLEFGIEGKTPFLVMDYAPNGTLRQRHARGIALALPTVVAYVQQVADALQYAHEEKLIHRDVKPENMLLGRRDEILLSDFGIALVAQSSRYQSTQEMAGTMAYMAPEQIQGKPKPASDQYSLGIVVYEWLTGERPFHGSAIEIISQHLAIPPVPLREKNPAIPKEVEEVLKIALAKDPKERFDNIQAFATALEQACYGQADMPTFVKPPHLNALPQRPAVALSTPQLPKTQIITPSPSMGRLISLYRGHTNTVETLAWSPDGKYIASGSSDKTVQLWEVGTGQKLFHYSRHAEKVNAVAWSPNQKYIASVSDDKTMHVWESVTGNSTFDHQGWAGAPKAVTWAPDNVHIATGDEEGSILVWDILSRQLLFRYRGHSKPVNAVVWSPDGQSLFSASKDGTVHVIDSYSGQRITLYKGRSGWIQTVTSSPKGELMAFAGFDTTVKLWNTSTKKPEATFQGHRSSVYTVAWSPRGIYIASGDANGKVHVWEAATRKHIYTFRGHASMVYAVAWSPDGNSIASASSDETVQIWAAP